MIAALCLAALLWLASFQLKAARDAQSSADPKGSDRLSKRGLWWNYADSWQWKYKAFPADLRPAFIGSTTWLVWLTDFWHFAAFASTCCQCATVLLVAYAAQHGAPLWQCALPLIPGPLSFEMAFKYWRKK